MWRRAPEPRGILRGANARATLGSQRHDTTTLHHTVARALTALLCGGAAAFVAVYAGIAALRLGYPFELEWMEGALVDWVRRLHAGQGLYVAPSVEFLPFGYPPLFPWLSAAVATVTGVGFLPLRIVSFAASLGSFVAIWLLVKRETGSRLWSFLATCLFAATFPISAGWFDVARIDSLGVFLLLVAFGLARFARTPRAAALAAVAFWVAFLAKQIALPAAVPVAVYHALFARRLFLPFALTFGVLIAATTWVMDALYDGWFSYYIFEFHAGRGYDPHLWPVFLRVDVLVLWAAVLLGIWFIALRLKQRESRPVGAFYLLILGELIATCAFARSLDLGAGPNVSIPIHAFLAVLFGVGGHALDVRLQRAEETAQGRWLRPLLLIACGLQFVWIAWDRRYDPRKYVPTAADRAAGEALVARLRAIDGDVFVPCHAWLAAQAGKRTWVHAVNIYDELYQERLQQRRGEAVEASPGIQQSVLQAIEEKRFAAIVLDYDWTSERWFQDAVEANYELAEHLFDPSDPAFRPVTGVPARPAKLFVRRD